MTLLDMIVREAAALPASAQQQVLDHIRLLNQQVLEQEMDALIEENLPAWRELAK